jgi:hypothetical protein
MLANQYAIFVRLNNGVGIMDFLTHATVTPIPEECDHWWHYYSEQDTTMVYLINPNQYRVCLSCGLEQQLIGKDIVDTKAVEAMCKEAKEDER